MLCPTLRDHVYLDWFPRSLFSPIAKDVASHFPQTKEEALQTALRYDLIFSQSGYVYTAILDPPHRGGANAPGESHAADDINGSISHPSPYTQQSYGYPHGGTSSSNTYAPPPSTLFSGSANA